MNLIERLPTENTLVYATFQDHRQLLNRIIDAYDSRVVRAYCRVRFTIININILHILSLCLRDRARVMDIGCGFGLFGCYFSALRPEINYHGYDLNSRRIEMANLAAARLSLPNASFLRRDARELTLEDEYDAIMMIDLLHHLDDASKEGLLAKCIQHLAPGGRLIIKDVTTRPFPKLAFTWALDVLMTHGFDMWYWDEGRFRSLLGGKFQRLDTFPITDLLPYPHIVYLAENRQ